jgi:hypothetical protein
MTPELITRHKKMSAQQSMTFFSPVGPFTRIFQKKKLQRQRATRHISFSLLRLSPVSSVMMESIRAQTGKVVNNSSAALVLFVEKRRNFDVFLFSSFRSDLSVSLCVALGESG